MPAILMQAVAGNSPSRPFRPPMQGDSSSAREKLLWNGSSQAGLFPLIETHLKQSIAQLPPEDKNKSVTGGHFTNFVASRC